jgi:hypothetical protein
MARVVRKWPRYTNQAHEMADRIFSWMLIQ